MVKIKKMMIEELVLPGNIEERMRRAMREEATGNFLMRIRNISKIHKGSSMIELKDFEKVMYLEGCTIYGGIKRIYMSSKMFKFGSDNVEVGIT